MPVSFYSDKPKASNCITHTDLTQIFLSYLGNETISIKCKLYCLILIHSLIKIQLSILEV